MAHGLNSVVIKRNPNTVGTQKTEGKVGGIGSRRIFAPQFKLQVLDSYRNDADCKGNQRATARKYGIHRRQIQKWLQVEQNLRNSVLKIKQQSGTVQHSPSRVQQVAIGCDSSDRDKKCLSEVALSDLRQQDDIKPGVYSHTVHEQRVPYIHVASPLVYTQTSPELHLVPTAASVSPRTPATADSALDFSAQPVAHHTDYYIRERELAVDFSCDDSCLYETVGTHPPYPIDLSIKKPQCCSCSTAYCPPVIRPKSTYGSFYPPPIPYYLPTPPTNVDYEIWDLSLKKEPIKRKALMELPTSSVYESSPPPMKKVHFNEPSNAGWLPASPPLDNFVEQVSSSIPSVESLSPERKPSYHMLEVTSTPSSICTPPLEKKSATYHVLEVAPSNISPESRSPPPVKKQVKLFKPYLDDDDYCSSSSSSNASTKNEPEYQGFLNNNNNVEVLKTCEQPPPMPYYSYNAGVNTSPEPSSATEDLYPSYRYADSQCDDVQKQRQSYSLKFKLSAIECYYNDEACRGNQRAVANKYRVHRRQVQKWLKQESELRERIQTASAIVVS